MLADTDKDPVPMQSTREEYTCNHGTSAPVLNNPDGTGSDPSRSYRQRQIKNPESYRRRSVADDVRHQRPDEVSYVPSSRLQSVRTDDDVRRNRRTPFDPCFAATSGGRTPRNDVAPILHNFAQRRWTFSRVDERRPPRSARPSRPIPPLNAVSFINTRRLSYPLRTSFESRCANNCYAH